MQLNIFVPSLSLKVVLLLTTLAIALLTKQSSNNQPQLSPAVLLPGDTAIGTAAGDQTAPQISKGANGYLAVWQDSRGYLSGTSFNLPELPSYSEVFAARMDASGNLIDYSPIVLSRSQSSQLTPNVAWNGQHWLVTWQEVSLDQNDCSGCRIIKGVRVSADGEVIDFTPIRIGNPYENFSVIRL
ncbi:MAG: hypothetical protein AAB401_14165, partial [Acidobacteriota bacterium]